MLLRHNIYETLRADILACRIAPGEEMREQELASRYEVSRQPVREALLRLEHAQLVTVSPRQGYRVNPISVSDARDIFRFRLVLEPACAVAAAESMETERLAELDAFRSFDAEQDFIEYNRAFHCALAHASGNARMAAAACDLIEQADRLVRISLSAIKGRDPTELVKEHIAIIDAIQFREARKAKRLVQAHVAEAEKRVLSALTRSAVIA